MNGGRWPMLLWLHARWRPRRSSFVPYIVVTLQNEILNSHRAGHGYSKHHLRVNSDTYILF